MLMCTVCFLKKAIYVKSIFLKNLCRPYILIWCYQKILQVADYLEQLFY